MFSTNEYHFKDHRICFNANIFTAQVQECQTIMGNVHKRIQQSELLIIYQFKSRCLCALLHCFVNGIIRGIHWYRRSFKLPLVDQKLTTDGSSSIVCRCQSRAVRHMQDMITVDFILKSGTLILMHVSPPPDRIVSPSINKNVCLIWTDSNRCKASVMAPCGIVGGWSTIMYSYSRANSCELSIARSKNKMN